jgi:hypothetical protein
MTEPIGQNQGVGERDMQIDKETGDPVTIPPDGEKKNRPKGVAPEDRLRIDPESRIPRPVQPDLA